MSSLLSSPHASATPSRYLAGSPERYLSQTSSALGGPTPQELGVGAMPAEDDKRYRRSIHALEAEVDQLLSTAARGGRGISSLRETQRSLEITKAQLSTELRASRTRETELEQLLSRRTTTESTHAGLKVEVDEARTEILRLRSALQAATSDASDARSERLREQNQNEALLRSQLAEATKAAGDAKHECGRLRSACRQAQADAERCVKVAEAAAEAASKREEENKREFLRQKASHDGALVEAQRRVDAKIAQLEHDYRRDAHATVKEREEAHAAALARERSEHEQKKKGEKLANFGGSSLGRSPLVSAHFSTSDHLSGRSRRTDPFSGPSASKTPMLKRR